MKTANIGELVEITIGRTPSRSNEDLWDKKKHTSNVWLSIADLLNADGRVVTDSKEYITDEAAKTFAIVPRGTLLVSFKLTLGRLAYAGLDLRTNEAIAALHNGQTEVLDDYLYHYLSQFNWSEYAKADQKVKGLTLNKAKLAEITVTYPESLEEQRRIVARLDAAFEKIDRAIELTEKNLSHSNALFASSLGKLLSQSATENMKLGGVITLQRGFDLPTKNRKAGGVPLVSSSGEIDTHSEHKVAGPGVYTGRSGSVGNTFYIEKSYWPLNTTLYVKDFHGNDPRYCYWLLKSLDLRQFAGGVGVPTLNRNVVHEYNVTITPKANQKKVSNKIDIISEKTSSFTSLYTRKIEYLKALKQSLLSQAFSQDKVI